MNILHGVSAGKVFQEAFDVEEEKILIFNDILSCGPLKEYADMESWKTFREKYWNQFELYGYKERPSFEDIERDFYTNFDDFKSADSFKLWIGTGLGDQLLLAFIVHLMGYYGLDMQKLEVYQFEKIQRKHFAIEAWGIALLRTEEVQNHPSAYVLTSKEVVMAQKAWEAVTSPTPEKYLQYLHSDKDTLFLLKKSMGFLFLRYPNITNGLPYWDEALLKYTEKQAPRSARIIGDVLGYEYHDKYNLDIVGDFYLFNRLNNLGRANLAKPLVKVNTFDLPMRETETTILPDGIKALSGEINMIEENGIDDWVCGVHLDSSSDGLWVRDDRKLVWKNFSDKL